MRNLGKLLRELLEPIKNPATALMLLLDIGAMICILFPFSVE